ncbi:unnamed protein product [Linum trigynum]|uniref:Uncharacterized protein n=1 Tax=Linum trigynum TaxID=586398 RepID=A0AAV2E7P0_9ROSI
MKHPPTTSPQPSDEGRPASTVASRCEDSTTRHLRDFDRHFSSQHKLPLPSSLAVATEIAPLMRLSISNQETV